MRIATLLTATVMSASLALLATASAQDSAEDDRDAGLAEWDAIHDVFSHPRCINCHVEDERPRWSGPHYGPTRVHGFNVQRGEDGFGNPGLRCQTCHAETNSEELHGPPGVEDWHLAPAEMVWFEKNSGHICNQIKDPERNGGKTLEEVAEHVRDDALVAWGWQPGPGRQPAPGSARETFEALQRWIDHGAPCPNP